ncbi:MAG: metal-dependent hydrolase [Rubritalea sp.]|uniref:metal-dependent hydrolase n=1 Tax=Rubritalea sp. TaxID=2109375 RepID=UPI0032422EB7
MDSITQAALGGLCGELLLRKQLGWKGAVWGVFFGTLPDLDIVIAPLVDSMDWLRTHRSLSHSLFLMLLMSPVFGYLLCKLHSKVSLARATGFVLLAWSTHVLIDCFNSYGTQVFEPFSDYRLTLNNMSIIDPLFTVPMLLGNFICLFLARDGKKRSWVVCSTTTWISLYTLLSFTLLEVAKKHFRTELAQSELEVSGMLVSPSLANIFLWRMVARDAEHYYVSYWSVWDSPDRPFHLDLVPRTPKLAEPYQGSKPFKTLNWFSEGWWKVISNGEGTNSIYLIDMRFGEMNMLETDPAIKAPPFVWKLSIDAQGNVTESRASLRAEFDPKKTIFQLKERAAGRAPNWTESIWPWEKLAQQTQ